MTPTPAKFLLGKLHPGVLGLTIQAAAGNANDDETVYIGDSDVDMQTGANAGVRTIGVSYGFRSRDELAAYSPWAVCDSPEEVAEAILENTVM